MCGSDFEGGNKIKYCKDRKAFLFFFVGGAQGEEQETSSRKGLLDPPMTSKTPNAQYHPKEQINQKF